MGRRKDHPIPTDKPDARSVEADQRKLRASIAQSKRLAAEADAMIRRNKDESDPADARVADGVGGPGEDA